MTSTVESYIKDHGITVHETYKAFKKQILDAWKDTNEELLVPTAPVPMRLLTCILNYTRVMDELYKEEDALTFNGKATLNCVTDLLLTPV